MYEYNDGVKSWEALPALRLTGNGFESEPGLGYDQIKKIRSIYIDGCNGASLSSLVKKYGSSFITVKAILNGEKFTDITDQIDLKYQVKFNDNTVYQACLEYFHGMTQRGAAEKHGLKASFLSKVLRKKTKPHIANRLKEIDGYEYYKK